MARLTNHELTAASGEVIFRNRRAVRAENDTLRITVTIEGGHVAEILHKPSGISPLWIPHWDSIEPSAYQPSMHPQYGDEGEGRLLAGIMGHNLCLDTFGAPSEAEAAAGMPVHGEAPTATYQTLSDGRILRQDCVFPKAQIAFQRQISVPSLGSVIRFSERLTNLSPTDRPIAWTQHVTIGPPFLEPGSTRFRATATRSQVIDSFFNGGLGPQKSGAEFLWPLCPRKDGGTDDFRAFTSEAVSGGFTTHLMDPAREQACFLAWSRAFQLLFGYVWRRADFPWLGRWEENHVRTAPPWNGQGLACGMEFGVSPLLESRRQMVERGNLFGVPAYRWLPAGECIGADYCAFIVSSDSIPDAAIWDGMHTITFE